MPDLKIEVDAKKIASEFGELAKEVEKDITKAVGALAASTHAKALELSTEKLKSTASMYKEALDFEKIGKNIWVVSLDMKKAGWLEDGRKCIVYGKGRLDQPKVLTPDGPVRIDEVKVGMLVLNQFGKWTTVEEIYDEHIVQKSKMLFQRIEQCNYDPGNKKRHKRINSVFLAKCPVCEHVVKYDKFKKSYLKNEVFCQKCLSRQKIVTIETPSKFTNRKTRNRNKLIVTGDHKIMTQRGWVEAWDLKENDSLSIPSWSSCKTCKKDTYLGLDFCYCKKGNACLASYTVKQTFKKGNHQSQQPDSRSKYLERLNKLQKTNNTEEFFSKEAAKFGYKTGIYFKNIDLNEYDFIREYPVKVPSDGIYESKYFFIDFFCPKLNIGFEIDGKAFHSEIRDNKRDYQIKKAIGAEIIRIPAKNVWKKDFFKENIEPILKNHSGEISFLPLKGYKIKKHFIKPNSSVCRRWDITVKDGESFVCNGFLIHNSGFMEELLRGKSSKVSANGKRYAVIPFKHNKKPTDQTPKAQDLSNQIKGFLRKEKIPYQKLEFNADGSPKLGLLHKFDLDSAKPSAKAKDPALKGLAIYQRMNEKGKVVKDIMTFRVITEDHKAEGKWHHPGSKGVFIIDAAYDWALREWDSTILPSILEKYK